MWHNSAAQSTPPNHHRQYIKHPCQVNTPPTTPPDETMSCQLHSQYKQFLFTAVVRSLCAPPPLLCSSEICFLFKNNFPHGVSSNCHSYAHYPSPAMINPLDKLQSMQVFFFKKQISPFPLAEIRHLIFFTSGATGVIVACERPPTALDAKGVATDGRAPGRAPGRNGGAAIQHTDITSVSQGSPGTWTVS